jgi:peptidoglycan/xylan/chitin deacetylase (PgdA/CDA1 family)
MKGDPLRVLMYHRVIEPAAADGHNPSVVSASPATFARQMRHLARNYRVVSAEEVLGAVHDRHPLPPRAVLITFDDAYRDFGEIAWPILRRYGLSATLFVPTAFPDRPDRAFWWDRLARALNSSSRRESILTPCGLLPLHSATARLSSLRALRKYLKSIPHRTAMELVDELCRDLVEEEEGSRGAVLSWNELRELSDDGVELGAHTRSHPALTQVPGEQARAEIRGSREDLEREIGSRPRVFSYPFGDCDERVAEMVKQEGFQMAVTCHYGWSRLPQADPFQLRRTNITLRTTPMVFLARLSTCGGHLDSWRLAVKEWRVRRHSALPAAI